MTRKKKNKNKGGNGSGGPHTPNDGVVQQQQQEQQEQQQVAVVAPETIKGMDDKGNFYDSHEALRTVQALNRSDFYAANRLFWEKLGGGGYGGKTDDEAMIGDSDGIQDGVEGLAFLDRFLLHGSNIKSTGTAAAAAAKATTASRRHRFDHALDVGAGVGRISKLILLKRYEQVRLVEGDEGWSKQSRIYLGKKRAARCSFIHQRLDDVTKQHVLDWCPTTKSKADLIWVQWVLQYLVDDDVVHLLRNLIGGLRPGSGIIVVKENRPFGKARNDRFQMDVPGGHTGGNARYDITRTDNHHRLLFGNAGLTVLFVEQGVETNSYVLSALG